MWPQQAQPLEVEISVLPDQPAHPNSDIEELAAQMKDLVADKQLLMIPAMPQNNNSGFMVFLGHEEMSASEFCDLAVTAGAKLFYAQANTFDAERDLAESDLRVGRHRALPWQSSEEDAGLASLREEASVYNGRIGEIALGFAADGVLHCWIVTAAWYDRLVERLEGLEPDVSQMFGRMPEAEARALTDRLAQELIQMPEFQS